jgi:hypothetical protein
MSFHRLSQFESPRVRRRSVSCSLTDISASDGITELVAGTNSCRKRVIGPEARSRNALIGSSAVALFPTAAPPHCCQFRGPTRRFEKIIDMRAEIGGRD